LKGLHRGQGLYQAPARQISTCRQSDPTQKSRIPVTGGLCQPVSEAKATISDFRSMTPIDGCQSPFHKHGKEFACFSSKTGATRDRQIWDAECLHVSTILLYAPFMRGANAMQAKWCQLVKKKAPPPRLRCFVECAYMCTMKSCTAGCWLLHERVSEC